MDHLPTAPVVAAGLVGGFAAARYSGHRWTGGVVLAAAGGISARSWSAGSGRGVTSALLAMYVVAFVGSHPLAHRLGPWGSVLIVTAAASAVTWVVADRGTNHD